MEHFQLDAILLSAVADMDPATLFPYVIPMPIPCPGWCGDDYIFLISEPVAPQIEAGLVGQRHVALLKASLAAFCTDQQRPQHLRTDGLTVWPVVPFVLTIDDVTITATYR